MPTPTLADVLWLVAANGYAREAMDALAVCRDTWADQRLWDRVVHVRDAGGMTRLMLAAAEGDEACVACELRHGADPSLRDGGDFTALDLTLWGTSDWDPASPQPVGYEACALQLIAAMVARGAAMTAPASYAARTTMYGALSHSSVRVLDALLAAGVSPSAVSFGRTPLRYAVRYLFLGGVSRLLSAGATGMNDALHAALAMVVNNESKARICAPVVTALLDAGAGIGANETFPMSESVFKPGFPLLRLLHTATVAADGRLMRMVATLAIQESRQDVLGLVLGRGVCAGGLMYISAYPTAVTLLRFAAYCDNLSAANTLLDSGAHVNAVSGEDEDEDTALGEALARGHKAMADLLRRRGATE